MLGEDDLDSLIDKFVVRHGREIEVLKQLLERVSRYARIYSDGEVVLLSKDLTTTDKIFIVVLTRYLAAKINELKGEEIVKNVSEYTEVGEISRIIGKPSNQVSARLSDLEKKGYIRRVGKGRYTITSLNKALEYLNKLEEKGVKNNSEK